MVVWRIWSRIAHQAYEYLGEAEGETFEEACHAFAKAHPTFGADFEPVRMTHNGNELLPLDGRVDGQRVQFGVWTAQKEPSPGKP
jgi:hypothetical protein